MAVKVGIITGTLWLHVFLMWKTRDRYLTEINFTGSSCYARLFNNHVLKTINNEAKLGLASLCIGGGMGTALILKKC